MSLDGNIRANCAQDYAIAVKSSRSGMAQWPERPYLGRP